MHKLRVYIDTSVIGGCFDPEFKLDSIALFEKIKQGKMIAVISELTIQELEPAPEHVKNVLEQIPDEFLEQIALPVEAKSLAQAYISSGAVPDHSEVDALHIATATIHNVDVLVSWNFKHIVNIRRIHAYNGVNVKEGYRLLDIHSPKEVLYGEEI
ncbi:MAG: PIN domain protein [Elusimicrobia bacterium]|nr:PIN domain protein [Elusimicrobiota bacterium]